MLGFCLKHNALRTDERWQFLQENIEVVLMRLQQPATMEKCTECLSEDARVERIKQILNGGHNGEKMANKG